METQRKYVGSRRLSPAARRVVTAALVAATIGVPTVALAVEPASVTAQLPDAAKETPMSGSGIGATEEDNLSWKLEDNGTRIDGNGQEAPAYKLTISGSGAMKDFTRTGSGTPETEGGFISDAPWDWAQHSITAVTIDDGITHIGTYAFYFTSIEDVSVPDTVTSLGTLCFGDTTTLKSVKLGHALETIGEGAFIRCSNLEKVTIPASVTTIDQSAFLCANRLASLTIEGGSQSLSIGTQAFAECTINSLVIPSRVASIGGAAFANHVYSSTTGKEVDSALETLRFEPNDSIEIGNYAFKNAAKLDSLDLTTLDIFQDAWGRSPFYGANSLKELKLPTSSKFESIPDSAFAGTGGYQKLVISDNVKSIGADAFSGDNTKLNAVIVEGDITDGNAFGHFFAKQKNNSDFVLYLQSGNGADALKTNSQMMGLCYVAVLDGGHFHADQEFSESATIYSPIKNGNVLQNTWKFGGSKSVDIKDGKAKPYEEDGKYRKDARYLAQWTPGSYSISTDALDFGSLTYGYSVDDLNKVDSKSIVPKVISGSVKDNAIKDVSCSTGDFRVIKAADGRSASVLLARTGLDAGTHEAEVYVTMDVGSTFTVPVKFEVAKATVKNSPTENKSVAYAPGLEMDASELFAIDANAGAQTYEITDGRDIATLSGYTLYVKKPGTVKVKLTTAATDNYNADSTGVEATLVVAKGDASVTLAPDKTEMTGAGTVTFTVDAPEGVNVTGIEGVSKDGKPKVEVRSEGDGKWVASLPNVTAEYSFTASYSGGGYYKDGEATATVKVTYKSSTGGGGGTVVPTLTKYKVDVADAENGTVKADRATAAKGDKVTLTATAAEGYRTSAVTVTDASGKAVSLTLNADGTYSFEMPASDVKVVASFVKQEAKAFPDVDQSAWYAKGVAFVSSRGIMGGYPDGTFGVGKTLTRAEFAQLLYKRAGGVDDKTAKNETGMADVADSEWYTAAANWAVANGVINGYGNADGTRTFGPDDPVTLEQMVAIIANLEKADVTKADASVLGRFVDPGDVSPWFTQSVAWAVQAGLVNGSVEGDGLHIRPAEPIMRERVASVIMNAYDKGVLK